MGTQQRNIRFRQLAADLLWDEPRQTAMAKWEAAFDKRRRGGRDWLPTRFVQVAVLRFAPDGRIAHLEEYCPGPSFKGRSSGLSVLRRKSSF